MSSFLAYGPESLSDASSSNEIHSVGVEDFVLETTKAPVRVYYPATKPENPEPVRAFRDSKNFVNGYTWTFSRNRPWIGGVLSTLVSSLRFAIPMRYLEIPNAWRNAKPEGENLPLVIFSHGLTGTGEENSLLLASIAAHGFVVASVHHTDGSSCVVTTGDGKEIWYVHPDPENYSIRFREDQLNHRVQEMMDVRTAMLKHSELGSCIDESKVVASGYSYGGATAALTTVRNKEEFSACVVIDGWFHINMYGVNTYFPLDVMKEKTLPVPSFFLNCAAFMGKEVGPMAKKLAAGSPNHRHKVYGSSTTHMLFIDLLSWIPDLIRNQLKSLLVKVQGEESGAITEEYITDIIKWLVLKTKGDQVQL